MPPSDSTLIALKALLLGHAAAIRPLRRRAALAMTSAAVNQLKRVRQPELRLRLAFYHLVRAEILRHDGDPLPDRVTAQAISRALQSDVYGRFMRLESVTTDLLAHNLQDGTGHRYIFETRALNAFGVSKSWLSSVQLTFLESITLGEILQHHGIPFSAA